MPAQYLAIKRKKLAEGLSVKEAEKHAAMIYNSKHPDNPVTGKSEGKKKRPGVERKKG